ncbi:MAG: ester cyclase [Saprospiraceae bacterium]|nr:ester cyclase [Saprospiraceae bacterium]
MTNKEIVKAWYIAMDAQDFGTLKNLMGGKYQFHNPFTPAPVGSDDHIGMSKMMSSSFGNGNHHVEFTVEEGDHVAIRAKWSAKHTGEFNGIPATGNLIELYFLGMFHIVDGKVLSCHIEFNPAAIMTQVSATPANP